MEVTGLYGDGLGKVKVTRSAEQRVGCTMIVCVGGERK